MNRRRHPDHIQSHIGVIHLTFGWLNKRPLVRAILGEMDIGLISPARTHSRLETDLLLVIDIGAMAGLIVSKALAHLLPKRVSSQNTDQITNCLRRLH